MFSLLKRIIVLLALAPSISFAQTPGAFPIGQPLSGSLLNGTFGNKIDLNNGAGANTALTNPVISGGLWTNISINGGNLAGTLNGGTLNGTTLVNSIFVGASGTPNQTSVSCGTSSTTLLAANQAAAFIAVKVPPGGSGSIWTNWAGSAAVASTPSLEVPVGAELIWSTASGFVPTSQANCIAVGSPVSVTLLWK